MLPDFSSAQGGSLLQYPSFDVGGVLSVSYCLSLVVANGMGSDLKVKIPLVFAPTYPERMAAPPAAPVAVAAPPSMAPYVAATAVSPMHVAVVDVRGHRRRRSIAFSYPSLRTHTISRPRRCPWRTAWRSRPRRTRLRRRLSDEVVRGVWEGKGIGLGTCLYII